MPEAARRPQAAIDATREGPALLVIDLHGLSPVAAGEKLAADLAAARTRGERVVRVIHGRGKHSDVFPVLKSFVRRWVEESAFAHREIEAVYRGEDGSPYTVPNPGEVVLVLRGGGMEPPILSWEDEEEREARKNAKALRADRLRTLRRRGPRR
ncbi:MAG: Smr/MutS family protein [Bacteroidota bacterium]